MNTPAGNGSPEYEAVMRQIAELDAALRAARISDTSLEGWRNRQENEQRLASLKRQAYMLRYPRSSHCPRCHGTKTVHAQYCSCCRRAADDEDNDRRMLAAFRTEESQRLLALRSGKRKDRHVRAFQRWRRWRRKYVRSFMGGRAQGKNACLCGDYKELCAKMCATCQDAKNILKRRIQQRSPDNRDEPPISQSREPRVIRVLTPGIYESDPGCGWDDIVKIIEENR